MLIKKETIQLINRKNPEIKTLNLKNFGVTNEDLASLIDNLNQNEFIQELDLNGNYLNNDSIDTILQLKNIRKIDLNCNRFCGDALKRLLESENFTHSLIFCKKNRELAPELVDLVRAHNLAIDASDTDLIREMHPLQHRRMTLWALAGLSKKELADFRASDHESKFYKP